jgi:hypothetical protein
MNKELIHYSDDEGLQFMDKGPQRYDKNMDPL